MILMIVVLGILVCALQAVLSPRLLVSAVWLAFCSALVALLMYMLGAPEVAVVELSVGAGLVTVLFVFAINLTGEETLSLQALIPPPLAWTLLLVALILLGLVILPGVDKLVPLGVSAAFSSVVWRDREMDMLLQVALIFAGVLGVLGLLAGNDQCEKSSDEPEKEKA